MNVQTVSLWNLSGVVNRGMPRLPPEPGALTAAQQVTSTRVDGHIIVLMNRPLLESDAADVPGFGIRDPGFG